MKNVNRLTGWINLNNSVMCQWIYNYLAKAKKLSYTTYIESHDPNHPQVDAFIRTIEDCAEHREFIHKMRAAWRQEQYRKGNKSKLKQQYSFVLSKRTSKELDFLSRQINLPRNQTLEHLISKNYEPVWNKLNQAKEEKRKLQNERENNKIKREFYKLMSYVPEKEYQDVKTERDELQARCAQLESELEQLRSNKVKKDGNCESNPNRSHQTTERKTL